MNCEGKDLIKIYETKNYTPQTIRNLLSKLKKEKLVESKARSVYGITTYGKEVIESLSNKVHFYNLEWDGSWYMLMAEIPETERRKRDAFRRSLVHLGFGQFYKSVYVYPWDLTKEVLQLIHSLEIEN
jgi:phenylacetic acid degradation operon negative regulatory protein